MVSMVLLLYYKFKKKKIFIVDAVKFITLWFESKSIHFSQMVCLYQLWSLRLVWSVRFVLFKSSINLRRNKKRDLKKQCFRCQIVTSIGYGVVFNVFSFFAIYWRYLFSGSRVSTTKHRIMIVKLVHAVFFYF